jgi:NhaP-type Na+/H+ and K+/H+ antiporter
LRIHGTTRARFCGPDRRGWGRRASAGGRPPFKPVGGSRRGEAARRIALAVEGTILAVLTAVVARPLAVFIATSRQGFDAREKAVLGWAGLRGAVPVVLATFPVIEGVPRAHELFAIAFFAVLLSTVVQGTTFEALARRLRVTG